MKKMLLLESEPGIRCRVQVLRTIIAQFPVIVPGAEETLFEALFGLLPKIFSARMRASKKTHVFAVCGDSPPGKGAVPARELLPA